MQLKNRKANKLKGALSMATALLMAATHSGYADEFKAAGEITENETKQELSFSKSVVKEFQKWEIDSSVLYYKESGRVSAIEPVLSAKRKFDKEDRFLSVKLVLDVLTGPSPTGVSKANIAQTFTSPSGGKTYTVQPGQVPMNDEFKDTRVAATVGWQEPISRINRINFAGNFSTEYDFFSYGASAGYQHDLNEKNTTLNLGVSYEVDSIKPVGGVPVERGIEGTPTTPVAVQPKRGMSESKTVMDAMVGVSQVFNRHLIGQLNYGISRSEGYMEDPYKLFSVVDGTGTPIEYQYEKRPDDRMKHSVFTQLKYIFSEDVLSFGYRFMMDNWGISSHTVDLRYRASLVGTHYLEPHARVYMQSAADFYSYNFSNTTLAADQNASADYRLGEMMAYTAGLKYGFKAFNKHDFAVKAEYYMQDPKDNQDPLKAIIFNLSYYF